jgi:hypothetical protein
MRWHVPAPRSCMWRSPADGPISSDHLISTPEFSIEYDVRRVVTDWQRSAADRLCVIWSRSAPTTVG